MSNLVLQEQEFPYPEDWCLIYARAARDRPFFDLLQTDPRRALDEFGEDPRIGKHFTKLFNICALERVDRMQAKDIESLAQRARWLEGARPFEGDLSAADSERLSRAISLSTGLDDGLNLDPCGDGDICIAPACC